MEIIGTNGNDFINGRAGNDSIFGEDGNDKLDGGRGNDQLCDKDGNDYLDGSAGDDIFILNNSSSSVRGRKIPRIGLFTIAALALCTLTQTVQVVLPRYSLQPCLVILCSPELILSLSEFKHQRATIELLQKLLLLIL